jgi:hypothetical protein
MKAVGKTQEYMGFKIRVKYAGTASSNQPFK